MGFRTQKLLVGTLLLASTGLPARAQAQSAADRETARALMDEGFVRREKNDHKGALERFEAADALMHVPTTGLEVARERIAMGKLIEGREALSTVLRHPPRAGEPPPFTEARAQAARLDEELSGRIPSLKIVLHGAEGAASVTVDGIEVPQASLVAARKLNPGSHTVVARAGGRERREPVTLRERESKEVVLDLAAPPAPPPTIEARKTEETSPPSGPSNAPRILTYTGFGIAIVGVAVGSIAGISAISSATSAKSGCTNNQCPPNTHSDIDASITAGDISTAAFIIAGLGTAAGIVGLVLTKSASADTASVWIGPGGVRGLF
jgi:hypothetical protein